MLLTNKTETLEERQNMTALKLEFELGKLFDRGMYYIMIMPHNKVNIILPKDEIYKNL
jgi:hypothetical protein